MFAYFPHPSEKNEPSIHLSNEYSFFGWPFSLNMHPNQKQLLVTQRCLSLVSVLQHVLNFDINERISEIKLIVCHHRKWLNIIASVNDGFQ